MRIELPSYSFTHMAAILIAGGIHIALAVWAMLQKNELLYKQLESSIYLNEKFMTLLIKFGTLEYGKEMKIKFSAVIGEEHEKLKPPVIKSWEDNYIWFPKKKSWWAKIRAKIKDKFALKNS